MDKAVAKYRIIEKILNEEDNVLNVSMLCSTAGVSRQGYYYWLRTKDVRNKREEQDRKGKPLDSYWKPTTSEDMQRVQEEST